MTFYRTSPEVVAAETEFEDGKVPDGVIMNLREPAPEMLPFEERLTEACRDNIATERAYSSRDNAAYLAMLDEHAKLNSELSQILFEQNQNAMHVKPSKPMAERLQKRADLKQEEIKTLKDNYELKKLSDPGPMGSAIEEWLNSMVNSAKRFADFDFSEERLNEGATFADMCEQYRTIAKRLREELTVLMKAPRTAAEIEATARLFIKSHKAKLDQVISATRSVTVRNGKVRPRNPAFPNTGIPNGVGGVTRVLDSTAIMFALAPDAEELFVEKCLAGHQESLAIADADREQRMHDIEVGMLDTEYRFNHWFRLAMEKGEKPGKRLGGVLPVLGIVEA